LPTFCPIIKKEGVKMEDKEIKKNTTLKAVSVVFAILTFAYTLYLTSNYNNQNGMLGGVLSLLDWVAYLAVLYFINNKFKAKTGLGIFLAIVGLLLFVFADLVVCVNSINLHLH